MTTYAEVQGTTLIKYPYTFEDLQKENSSTNYNGDTDFVSIFPATDTALQKGYSLAPVTIADQPAYDPATQAVAQDDQPTLINGVWMLGWTVRQLSAEEIAEASATARLAAYEAAISAGITITSTGAPSLNGTYGVAQSNQNAISAVMTGVANGLGLPGGQSTFVYLDTAGDAHLFTADQFKYFAIAVRDYVYQLALFSAGQGAKPSRTVNIP